MRIIRHIYRFSLACLSAGLLTGCGAIEESSVGASDRVSALPAYSTVFGKENEKSENSDQSTISADDTEEAFDFTSDGKPTHAQLEAAAREYYFWPTYERSFTMNGTGTFLNENDVHVSRIQDALTGETKYYTAYYKTFQKRGEWDYDVQMMSRLYNVDGTLVRDWEETQYQESIGDWVLKQKYIDFNVAEDIDGVSKLLNMKTGEEKTDIQYINKINDAAVFVQTKDSKVAFTVDAEGNVLYDFDTLKDDLTGDYSFSSCRDYVIAEESKNGLYRLSFYTPEGQKLGSVDNVESSYIDDTTILRPYINCDGVIYDPSGGDGGDLTPVFQIGEPRYYDGEVAVCGDYQSDGSLLYRLYDAKTAEALTADYQDICVETAYDGSTPENSSPFFVGLNNDTIEKIDRSGNVLARKTLENVSNISYATLYEDALVVGYNDTDDIMKECLLDANLQEVMPQGTYEGISPVYDTEGAEKTLLWTGLYYQDTEQLHYRMDLFTSDGTVLMRGASSFGAMTGGKISVIRGQSMGLIDTKGNWIIKLPKYEMSNDD